MSQMLLPGITAQPAKKKHGIKPGTKFNSLTVVCAHKRTKDRKTIYKCLCDCGKVTYVRDNNLKSGHIKSCGCKGLEVKKDNGISKTYDLTGRKFGSLVAIRENGKNKKGELYWLFRCELCGRELSFLGRWVRNKPDQKRCDCGEKKRKMRESKGYVKRRPRNNEQFAWDIYNVYIKDGWSVRDAATEEGYKRGSFLTTILIKYIPEYRNKSIQRRNKSRWARQLESCKKKSKLFRYESELQACCVERLRRKEIAYWERERDLTGFEIDIMTSDCCYELKVTTIKTDLYRAIGQLEINASKSGLKPVLVIPSDTTIAQSMQEVLTSKGIGVENELTI